jgi:hypothetical protein
MSPILAMPDSSGYGDKRGRNKRFGPGGGTRRLHHFTLRLPTPVPGAGRKAQQLWGRTRIDERVKDLAFARHDTTVIGSYRVVANDNYAEVALAA